MKENIAKVTEINNAKSFYCYVSEHIGPTNQNVKACAT